MEKFKGAIFDLDGTLLDSMGLWHKVDIAFFENRNMEIPEGYIQAISPLGTYKAAIYTKETYNIKESVEEIKVDKIKYTKKQAEEIGIITNNEKLKKTIPQDAERVKYYNNIWEDEVYLEVETVVQCLEKAGTYEKIEQ